jgi:FSR family fosmidomycin resistance protein-like MFS transporter
VISSIGVAMYHPEAVRFASYVAVAGGRQGTGMSVFAVGGMSGWALGPILTTPVVDIVGLHGTVIVALVPLIATLLVAANLRYFEQYRPTVATGHVAREELGESDWPAFTVAAAAGTLRTGALFGFQAFIPLYVWRTLDSSEGVGNAAIAVMLAAGAVGTLFGGRLSDVHGFRRVIVFSLLASAVLALLVPVVPLLVLFPLVAVFGLICEMNFYPIVVLAQRALPRHVGFASGVTLGLSIGLGSVCSPLLGVVADHSSLRTALFGAAALAVAGAAVSLALPREAA